MNKNLLRRMITLVITLSLGTSLASAQFAEDVLRLSQYGLGVGGRSLGMGNASVGGAEDYSALFWNPAGLAQLRSYEFSAGLSFLGYSDNTKFMGTATNANHNVVNLNNLGLVYPVPTVQGSLTFALGFNRVTNYTSATSFTGFNPSSSIMASLIPDVDLYSLSSSDVSDLLNNNIPYQLFLADTSNGRIVTPINGNVQQSGTIREGGGINHWSFGGGIDVARDFSVGVTLSLVSGSYSYDRVYTETDVNNVYQKLPADFYGQFDQFKYISTINSDISGFNAVIGLMYHKQGKFNFGFTVRTPTYYTIDETFSDEGKSRFDPNQNGVVDQYNITFNGKTRYKVTTPLVVSMGGAVHFRDFFILAADVDYTDWTQMKFDTQDATLLSENRLIQSIYRSTFNIRLGGEVLLWDLGVKLRAGAIVNQSPYEGDPASFDQVYYTAGAGFRLDRNVWLNVAYALGDWKTFRDNYYVAGVAASRTNEHVKTNNLNATLSFQF